MPLAILQIQLTNSGATDEHPFSQPVLNIGRAADNDVILEGSPVSTHHLRIEYAEGRFTVTDLRSRNGTHVNGQLLSPMTPAPLNLGDVIDLAEFKLTLRGAGDEDPLPVAERVQIGAQPQPGLIVRVKDGGKLTKTALVKPVTTLGRAKDNDIVVDHPQVSRHHAEIKQANDTFVIVDKGSANGLVFQDQRIGEHTLADGDTLTVGDGDEVSLQFRASIGLLAAEAVGQPTQAVQPVQSPTDASQTGFLNLKGLETISIGRAADNRIVIDHPQVSRHHALLERMGTRYRIHDLKSSNGVFVNGARVEREAWLKEGDEIRIGSIRLVLREDGVEQCAEEGLRLDAVRLHKRVSQAKNLLQDISLAILPQEFVALVGMSGSGKTTLLDALNGFRPATHGAVYVNGIDLYRNYDLFRNDLGYVPQKDIVHTELTVYNALDYAAQLRMPADTSPADRQRRIKEVLHDLDLTERQDLPVGKLSGGQLKRVNMGVELLTKPRLFFLDEATSGLDPGTEYDMMHLLRRLADQGRTIVLVTHATKNVMMCDKVVFLARGGYVAYFGPPEQALPYFDQYRTPQERQFKDMEFDDIYRILNDEARGQPKDWTERYQRSRQYRENVTARLQDRHQTSPIEQPASLTRRAGRSAKRAGTLRQFLILSARNLQILAQDRASLALMLLLAPIIGLMDFIWGGQLFDVEKGDAGKAITMLFMTALITILVGALSAVREIVKENDIYRRERAVNLRVPAYVLSKVWVGIVIALYQSLAYLVLKLLFVHPPLTASGLGAFYLTLVLGTLSGYLLGLVVSAAAPNQNTAMLLLIAVLVPQFLFTGALLPLNVIPGGPVISAVMSTRWGFEALVNISGIGYDVNRDACWNERTARELKNLSEEQKRKFGCTCMGAAMFDECRFPGLRRAYDQDTRNALASLAPAEPLQPTPYPTLTPIPGNTPSQDVAALRDKQNLEYARLREKQVQDFLDQLRGYGDKRVEWEMQRGRAIATGQSLIESIVDNYGQTFRGGATERWAALIIIMAIELALVLVFQKHKDAI